MTEKQNYLALDLGAESGRAILGSLTDGRLDLQEIHRFPNDGIVVGERIHWDALRLFAEMKTGLKLAWERTKGNLASLGIDTWGVDFGLLDSRGELLGNPVHYRDSRTKNIVSGAFEIVAREEIFARTGIQFLQFNTLFQLFAMMRTGSPQLEIADKLLMMPDLFNYWLTGRQSQEYTIATTSQCYDTKRNEWAFPLIDAFNIPRRLFGEVSPPASILGPIRSSVIDELKIGELPVALPATHDTGSAVIAVPATGANWAYISCGTWALVGAETKEPIINEKSLAYNSTNEGGAFGTNRLLCNVMGLWLLQQARRNWTRNGEQIPYGEIVAAAQSSPPFAAWIDPDHEGFFNPRDMVKAIADFCSATGQHPPETIGAVARCIIESLALKYRLKIERIEDMTGRRIEVIHMVGGGSRNDLLCQATADACARRVLAGPNEATAMGNLLVQAAASGALKGLNEVREVARASTEIREYLPTERGRWEEEFAKFRGRVGN